MDKPPNENLVDDFLTIFSLQFKWRWYHIYLIMTSKFYLFVGDITQFELLKRHWQKQVRPKCEKIVLCRCIVVWYDCLLYNYWYSTHMYTCSLQYTLSCQEQRTYIKRLPVHCMLLPATDLFLIRFFIKKYFSNYVG